MASWWDSIDSVAKFNYSMQVSIVILLFITAAATAVTIIASKRLGLLQSTEAATLKSRVGSAEESAAVARATAEESKKKLAQRTITGEQRTVLINVLRAGPSGSLKVYAVLGDFESINFATELDAALKEAGWSTDGVNQAIYTPAGPVGIELRVKSKESAPAHVQTLHRALAAIGINAPGVLDESLDPTLVELVVGHKPPEGTHRGG